MKKTIFTGSGTAIITPMNDDSSINYDTLDKLIDFQIKNGTDAIVVCGTTGEAATLSDEEYSKIVRHCVKKINKQIPVIAGSGSNDTKRALEKSIEAKKQGADALLLVTPYYNKTSQSGLVKHFTYIADRVDVPIILYNVPSRTGCNIEPETYLKLSKHKNIVAIKEANGNISSVAKTMSLCGNDIDVYSGNDEQTIPIMSLGGKGVISVFSNVCPGVSNKMCKNYLEGNVKDAKNYQIKYHELMSALFCDVNPIPVKFALNLLGFKCGNCRMPLDTLNTQKTERLKNIMKKYKLI